MDTVLFNFHDVVLILLSFECLLVAAILSLSQPNRPLSTWFFVGFLLCHSFMALHELIFWGKEFRLWMLDISPNFFFLGSYSYYLDGPLLYLFVRSLLYKDFTLARQNLWHLLPLALYAFLLVITFYSLDFSSRYQLIETQHIAYSSPFLYFDAASKYLRVFYACVGLLMVMNYGRRLQDSVANINRQDLVWLKAMMLTMLLLYGMDALLLSVKLAGLWQQNFNMNLLNDLGVSAYHLNFIAINILVLLKFSRFETVEAIDSPEVHGAEAEDPEELEAIARMEAGMQDPEIYAIANITLDKLASALDITPRKLSGLLKFHYKMNFYEFVNRHRVEQAKIRLADPAQDHKSIIDIFYEVGFNSKSVFNTFFKRMENMTPSQYRDSQRELNAKQGKGIFDH
ncbi:helix-turn-helix transcriptional regulator [Simiduia curdlanivorans]|uniref:Helix-turn-helix transcriptional regulator n=1 Tax=Simiduia curdlanivorans TaxID=1492769 RepID=A0ABV8V3P8_9GAMM|nr:helix-turn-helix transcriptional regulator [Simiduia curdlanivorans]MDN3637492.1 helix-turn-helix transcriptional regulator [Simiduia curdlanivorans]